MDPTGAEPPEQPSHRGGHRRHRYPARTRQVFVRLDDEEYDTLADAAARADLTPTGYVAEAALAAARGAAGPDSPVAGTGLSRAELAGLQRDLFATRTTLARIHEHLQQTTAAPRHGGHVPGWFAGTVHQCRRTLSDLDTVIAAIDRSLR